MTALDSRLGLSGRTLRACVDDHRSALVGYLPLGFPDVAGSIEAMRALCEGSDGLGVDLVEVGLPYTDPVLDGLAIQHAGTRALERGVRTHDVFGAVEAVAATGKQAVVMTYWNLVERYGPQAFARDLASAGGCGLITPDLTPDEAGEWIVASDEFGLDRIFLVSPSSTDARIASTTAACRGWVYATSVMGVTGTRTTTSSAAPGLVAKVREAAPDLPVGVGLGVSNGDQAADVARYADAVIVGSAFVKLLIENLSSLRSLVDDLAHGVRSPSTSRS